MHTVEIPAPSGADTETVITALETAALFRSKGDGQEAMRWLRRAAESAGEAGDDERALLLSRTVAELHDELDQVSASKAMPYPPPPSSRSSRPPSGNGRASLPPRPSSRPAPASLRPTPAPASLRPAVSSAPRTSAPPAPVPAATATPLPTPAATPTAKGARHAARVAVEISTSKPGVFEVRLLADGEASRVGSSEALLVMLDPASRLLSR